jgi:hypothetical protein
MVACDLSYSLSSSEAFELQVTSVYGMFGELVKEMIEKTG